MSASATNTAPAGPSSVAAPAATVAMVGAGQLARMTHQAAIALGVQLRVLAGDRLDPAVLAGAAHLIGSAEELADLRALAAGADVLSFDHERVPPEHLARLQSEGIRLAPSAAAKLHAQDKLEARWALAKLGFPLPPFAHAGTAAEVESFAAAHGWPLVGKAPRGGYDGRGVFELADHEAAAAALAAHEGGILLEPRLKIERELAVLVARSTNGQSVVYPVVETVQRQAMCREILAPARVAPALAAEARELALTLAGDIGATGVLAVELFVTAAGLLVNEMALRPHNSGHYSIEGCATSQFEQHLRAVLGWPLGSPTLVAPAVVTVNVLGQAHGGDPVAALPRALAVPGAHVHLYAKAPRAGRKLGHVTVCGEDLRTTREAARLAASLLEEPSS